MSAERRAGGKRARQRRIARAANLEASKAIQRAIVDQGMRWTDHGIFEGADEAEADRKVWRIIDELNARGGIPRPEREDTDAP